MFHERHTRSIYKSVTWTITAMIITTVVLYLFTKNLTTALVDAVTIQIVKLVFFYIHERVWNKSNFGQELRKVSN